LYHSIITFSESIDESTSSTQTTAGIIITVSVLVFVVAFTILLIYCYYKRKKRNRRRDENPNANEEETQSREEETSGVVEHPLLVPNTILLVGGVNNIAEDSLELLHYSRLPSYEETIRNTPSELPPRYEEEVAL